MHGHEEEGKRERKGRRMGKGRDACMTKAVNGGRAKAREFSNQHYERQMSERGRRPMKTVRTKMNKPRERREREREEKEVNGRSNYGRREIERGRGGDITIIG